MKNLEFDVCARLKEERLRLGVSQDEVANICEVGRATVQRWEKANSAPAYKLSLLLPLNFDVFYILSGTRMAHKLAGEATPPRAGDFEDDELAGSKASYSTELSDEEVQWLLWFRQITESDKGILKPMIKGFAERKLAQKQEVG